MGEVGGRVGRVVDELAGGIGRVALGLLVGIGETLEEEVEKLGGVGSDGGLHVGSALGNDTDTSGTLNVLRLGSGKLEDRLLKHLPQLGKGRAKGDGEADHDVEGSVDNKPVVLGRALLGLLVLVLITEVLLARVRAGDEGADDGDNLLHEVVLGEDGGAAGLESGSDVAVDLGDNRAWNS